MLKGKEYGGKPQRITTSQTGCEYAGERTTKYATYQCTGRSGFHALLCYIGNRKPKGKKLPSLFLHRRSLPCRSRKAVPQDSNGCDGIQIEFASFVRCIIHSFYKLDK